MKNSFTSAVSLGLAATVLAFSASAASAQYRQVIRSDPARCAPAAGASVMLTITNIAESRGNLRVQSYRGTKDDWLVSGKWLSRIEVPARAGTMRVCMPLPGAGTYAIAVRHDRNANGKTDLMEDGGGMSNNPSINVFNLGKPSFTRTRFQVGNAPMRQTIQMRYMR